MDDVVKAAKANPGNLNVGGQRPGGTEDHVCTYLLEKATGVKLNYTSFSGGSEVMSNTCSAGTSTLPGPTPTSASARSRAAWR